MGVLFLVTWALYVEDILLPLLTAAALGGLVGLERESQNRPAGLRTHILVSLGSALVMLVSIEMYHLVVGTTNVDPGRIAAQVISGIGFLGAGTIMREGMTVKGLTTAASLWVVAGVGLAAGAKLYLPAATAALIILFTLEMIPRAERRFRARGANLHLSIRADDSPGQLGLVTSVLGKWGATIKNVRLEQAGPGEIEVLLDLKLAASQSPAAMIAELTGLEGVHEVHKED